MIRVGGIRAVNAELLRSALRSRWPASAAAAYRPHTERKHCSVALGMSVDAALGWRPKQLSLGVRSVHFSSPMLRAERAGEEADDADAQCARNTRAERGVEKANAKAKGSERRVTTTVVEGPAATATYGIIALVVASFVVAMVANVANGYLRPDGQFWLYHRTLRTLKRDERLLGIMGGSIRGVHSRRTSNSRVNLLQCAKFVDEDGVKRCRLKFYVVPSNTGLDDAGVVFVEYDVSRFFQPQISYLIVQLIATNEKITLWENGQEVSRNSTRLPPSL